MLFLNRNEIYNLFYIYLLFTLYVFQFIFNCFELIIYKFRKYINLLTSSNKRKNNGVFSSTLQFLNYVFS